jgi:dynein heavy chain
LYIFRDFTLLEAIGDPVTVRDWIGHGLPNDNFSIESALIAFNASLWPLMLDPQNQANAWIKHMEQNNKLAITNQASDSFLKVWKISHVNHELDIR